MWRASGHIQWLIQAFPALFYTSHRMGDGQIFIILIYILKFPHSKFVLCKLHLPIRMFRFKRIVVWWAGLRNRKIWRRFRFRHFIWIRFRFRLRFRFRFQLRFRVIYMHIYIHIRIRICVYLCKRIHMHKLNKYGTYTKHILTQYTYIHIHIHMHICTWMCTYS